MEKQKWKFWRMDKFKSNNWNIVLNMKLNFALRKITVIINKTNISFTFNEFLSWRKRCSLDRFISVQENFHHVLHERQMTISVYCYIQDNRIRSGAVKNYSKSRQSFEKARLFAYLFFHKQWDYNKIMAWTSLQISRLNLSQTYLNWWYDKEWLIFVSINAWNWPFILMFLLLKIRLCTFYCGFNHFSTLSYS